ncbi:MAG: acyloxyacyl hydrolase [Hyphomonas sp.]|jgi:lipid A 3-O-deacylase
MRRYLFASVAAVASATAFAGSASADLVSEVRLGIMQENICVLDCDNANKEPGQSLNGDVLFHSPDFLGFIWSPKPYVMGSVNFQGETSFGGVGLHWSFPVAKSWQFEPSFGYVIHDGELASPYPDGDPRSLAFTEKHVLLGSRDLFRTTFGLHHDINETWGVEIMYEHLSHGQVLGNGRNQGLDNIGVRFSYSFD